jgi:hypothetical protein
MGGVEAVSCRDRLGGAEPDPVREFRGEGGVLDLRRVGRDDEVADGVDPGALGDQDDAAFSPIERLKVGRCDGAAVMGGAAALAREDGVEERIARRAALTQRDPDTLRGERFDLGGAALSQGCGRFSAAQPRLAQT